MSTPQVITQNISQHRVDTMHCIDTKQLDPVTLLQGTYALLIKHGIEYNAFCVWRFLNEHFDVNESGIISLLLTRNSLFFLIHFITVGIYIVITVSIVFIPRSCIRSQNITVS